MSRKRTLLRAALYALIAALFAMPFIRGHRCNRAGGSFDRIHLTCSVDPAAARPGGTGPLPHPASQP